MINRVTFGFKGKTYEVLANEVDTDSCPSADRAQDRKTDEEILSYPCVNLSFVSSDESAQDQYGRQMVRDKTSISHYGQYVASGFFWCHPEDEDAAYKQMCEALKDIKS